jgi:hypothetical protein
LKQAAAPTAAAAMRFTWREFAPQGELNGACEDWLTRQVRAAAAELPREVAEDQEEEWIEELATIGDRPRLAVGYVRGLSKAARTITAETERLKCDLAPAEGETENGTEQAETYDHEDLAGARLIALNMAINGQSRADVDQYIAENFDLKDRSAVLDELYAVVEE